MRSAFQRARHSVLTDVRMRCFAAVSHGLFAAESSTAAHDTRGGEGHLDARVTRAAAPLIRSSGQRGLIPACQRLDFW